LERAKAELLDWSDSGSSVMEVSHRSPAFVSVAEQAEASLRRLLSISDDYASSSFKAGLPCSSLRCRSI
jgi:phosphoserine aminotransferase